MSKYSSTFITILINILALTVIYFIHNDYLILGYFFLMLILGIVLIFNRKYNKIGIGFLLTTGLMLALAIIVFKYLSHMH